MGCDVAVPVPDSLIIDVAIGLGFTSAVFAALTPALTEAVSRFVGLRGGSRASVLPVRSPTSGCGVGRWRHSLWPNACT
jgi:hypothetical protein